MRGVYASFRSIIRSKNFGCVAMCSAVLFILRSRLITSEMMLHVVIYNYYHLKS